MTMSQVLLRQTRLLRWGLLIALLVSVVSILSAAPGEPQTYYRLSTDGPLPIGGDVHDLKISANGMYTVYRASQEITEVIQLYSVPTDGSQPALKVSALPNRGQHIEEYAISPDNSHVVYSADQDTRDVRELYSAPLDGSAAPTKLSGAMVENGGLPMYSGGFKISPDGSRVVYRADQDTDEVFELYSAPVDGSTAAVKLNGLLPPMLMTRVVHLLQRQSQQSRLEQSKQKVCRSD